MALVNINLGQHSYEIIIGKGVLEDCGRILTELTPGKRVLLVTNPIVGDLYGEVVGASLRENGFHVTTGYVPAGEEFKTLSEAEKLYDIAFSAGLDRRCPVVALGGGVIGDLAGFVAATYMRGVPFVQLPTTLLAQVDSSVGGKVAVNHPRGKNIIGSFYQPVVVISDTSTLRTLDARDIRSGLAEVIKYGIIRDREFFTWLEHNMERVLSLETVALAKIIKKSCIIKAGIVEEDEKELGTRALLNLGHTVGHAIEMLAGYGQYTHGEAVAMGTVVAARMAVYLGLIPESQEERIKNLLARARLPVNVPVDISTSDIIESMYGDKKTIGGKITFILPREIGRASIYKNIPPELIRQAVDNVRLG